MSKRRSSLAISKKNVDSNSSLENCLEDKSCAPYQNSISFVEVVAFLYKFQKLYDFPAVSFAMLEEALHYEEQNLVLLRPEWVASKTLADLYKSLIKCFGVNSDNFVNTTQLNDALFKLLKKCRPEEKDLHPAEMSLLPLYKAEACKEVCSLSAEQKLCMLTVFIDALLEMDQGQALTQSFSPDDLRTGPIAMDSQMNKLWYFGDTYLFLERADQMATKMRRSKPKIVEEIAEANAHLLSASKLEIVCKTSGDWNRLIEAYAKEKDVCNALSQHFDRITALENKRLKQEMLRAAVSRTSSRIQQKAEEKKREEELAKLKREEEKKRAMEEEKKRLEEEKLRNLYVQRAKANTSAANLESVSQMGTANKMSRKERLRLREQRKLEQQLNHQKDAEPSHCPASPSSTRSLPQQNDVNSTKKDASGNDLLHTSEHSVKKSELTHGAHPPTVNKNQNSEFREHPTNRFSECDKSKIRSALGVQTTSIKSSASKPSSSTQLNGFELANVKKYMKRPEQVQQEVFQRTVLPPHANPSYVWTPVRKSPNGYGTARPINSIQSGQRQYISPASHRVMDVSNAVNFPVAGPIKYFVPAKQYIDAEQDYPRHSFAQYTNEEQQERGYEVLWNPTKHSFNR